MTDLSDKIELRVDPSTPKGRELEEKFKKKFGDDVVVYHEMGELWEIPSARSGLAFLVGYENVKMAFLGNGYD
ncbi:MAG: hypothetical protein AB1393_10285 [Candidatus Edwardsbacteria bacterium]